MANLIIKPASGGGNKVILQNQAGNVDAITVEDSGAIAIPGNTTMSGTANALGTVTTGNISNSAIVYPAGHVLQMIYKHYPTSATYSATSSHKIMENSITPKKSGSKIIMNVQLSQHAPKFANPDSYDVRYGAGYHTSATSTIGNYTGFGGRTDTGNNLGMAGVDRCLEYSDVPRGNDYGTHGSQYNVDNKMFIVEASPSIPATPVPLYFALWIYTLSIFVMNSIFRGILREYQSCTI